MYHLRAVGVHKWMVGWLGSVDPKSTGPNFHQFGCSRDESYQRNKIGNLQTDGSSAHLWRINWDQTYWLAEEILQNTKHWFCLSINTFWCILGGGGFLPSNRMKNMFPKHSFWCGIGISSEVDTGLIAAFRLVSCKHDLIFCHFFNDQLVLSDVLKESLRSCFSSQLCSWAYPPKARVHFFAELFRIVHQESWGLHRRSLKIFMAHGYL